ncbi:MAG: cyclic GMP-AMP synthase DncV-like nucleotidyltransferase [Granulosicoccus sp.]
MADVQLQFIGFHNAIRQADDETKRAKREMLVDELREKLPKTRPAFKEFNQGSYAMHTNIFPIHGDDDLDVGLRFQDTGEAIGCPVALKEDIKAALTYANRTVIVRRPCVTVQYLKNGDPDYHIDLAVYALNEGLQSHLALAVGKSGSPIANRHWSEQDPLGVITSIKESFEKDSEERRQFRRCIRFLKRWRDERYNAEDGPISIALTVSAKRWFSPNLDLFNGAPNDHAAMRDWVSRMLAEFCVPIGSVSQQPRLRIEHIGYPYTDLLESMSDAAHERFRSKLSSLLSALDDAAQDVDPHRACVTLHAEFGRDFPIPDKSDTAKKVIPAVVSTGASA